MPIAKVKKTFNAKARDKWKTWIGSLNKNISNKNLWHQAKILQRIQPGRNTQVCTDSSWEEDLLNTLTPPYTSSPPLENIHPIVRRIKSKLCVLRNQGIEIVFIWVKAHAGILYNEKVDKLAKEAAQGTNYATHLLCLGDCVNAIKKDILKLWQDMYSSIAQTQQLNTVQYRRKYQPSHGTRI
nr:unnamed protein product [Callosobruchus analis]